MLTIKFKNANKVIRAFNQSPQIIAKEILKALDKSTTYTVGKVKLHIERGTDMWKPPIDTGAMRRGIHSSYINRQKIQAVIKPSSATPYATYVHGGTRRMKGRPFFEITKKHEEKNVSKFFNQALNNAIKKIARKAR